MTQRKPEEPQSRSSWERHRQSWMSTGCSYAVVHWTQFSEPIGKADTDADHQTSMQQPSSGVLVDRRTPPLNTMRDLAKRQSSIPAAMPGKDPIRSEGTDSSSRTVSNGYSFAVPVNTFGADIGQCGSGFTPLRQHPRHAQRHPRNSHRWPP